MSLLPIGVDVQRGAYCRLKLIKQEPDAPATWVLHAFEADLK